MVERTYDLSQTSNGVSGMLTVNAAPEIFGHIAPDGAPEMRAVNVGVYRPNLRYEVARVSNAGEKQLALVRLLRESEGAGIIYAATVKAVKNITDYLKQVGFEVAPHHGQLSPKERIENQARFLAGELKALVATDAFGAGLDKPDIRFVIHCDLPVSLEAYGEETSLAGRDGREARCSMLFQQADRRTQLFFIAGRYPTPRDAARVYAVLQLLRADESPAPLQQIQERASEVAKGKVRVILSMLKNMSLVREHRGARFTLLKVDIGAREMDLMAARQWRKEEGDHEKLERIMFYAQSPECRWKLLVNHCGHAGRVGEEAGNRCRCDNCLRAAAGQLTEAAKPDFIDQLFAFHERYEATIRPGDVVRLPAHGEVKVKAVEGDKIVVSFPGGETRKFKQEWVIR